MYTVLCYRTFSYDPGLIGQMAPKPTQVVQEPAHRLSPAWTVDLPPPGERLGAAWAING